MKHIPLIILFLCQSIFSQNIKNRIYGLVTDGDSPLSGVNIQISGALKSTSTDSNGKYSLFATPGDILIFSAIGMVQEELIVEDVTTRINLKMKSKIEKLDEVVVTKNKGQSQSNLRLQYASNKKIIRTYQGFLNSESLGYSLRVLDGTKLNIAAVDIFSAIVGKFAGVVVRNIGSFENKAIYIRSVGSITNPVPAIFDVDGLILLEAPEYLSLQDIDRIAIIPGLAGLLRYGSQAAGGVVVINTKQAVAVREPGTDRLYDRAKLRDNLYQNDAIDQEAIIKNSSNYIKDLYASKNSGQAERIFEKYRKSRENDPYFMVDSYLYFATRGDKEFGLNFIDRNRGLFKDAVVAKALAYAFDATQEKDRAHQLYKEIYSWRPDYAQSYRDLANSYRRIFDYKKSANIYLRYQHLINEDFFPNDSSGIRAIMNKEFQNLLLLQGADISKSLSMKGIKPSESNTGQIRLFFEWNDSEAEFDLQFVNPEGHYFTWQHSKDNNASRIREEKLRGYSCEEFLLDNTPSGEWQINLKYLGDKKLKSTYLKFTVFTNYGSPSQKSFTELFRLQLKSVNQKLATINVPASY